MILILANSKITLINDLWDEERIINSKLQGRLSTVVTLDKSPRRIWKTFVEKESAIGKWHDKQYFYKIVLKSTGT